MTSKAQRRILIGRQTAGYGTPVAPDTAIRAQTSLKVVADKTVVDEDIGSYAPARHYVGSVRGEGTLEQSAMYEEAAYPISMAMGDGSVAGGGPYTYTFPLPDGTAEDIVYYSMEYTDGGSHVIAADDVFATSLNIRGEAGEAWEIEADIVSGPTIPADALTGSGTPVANPTAIRMANTKMYLDAAYANIGTTQVNELISFDWKLDNLQHQKTFAASTYPQGGGNDRWETTLEVIVETYNSIMDAVHPNLIDTTQSAIRIKAENGASSATIDGNYMLVEVDTLDDRDGNNISKYVFKGEKDGSDNTGQVVVVASGPAAL